MDGQRSKQKHNQSLLHGISALQLMLRYGRSLGITEIARELELSKSSAHDLIATLGALGFVDKNPKTRRYSLSPAIFKFFGTFTQEFGQNSRIYAVLRARAQELETSLYVCALGRMHTYVICASGKYGDTMVIGSSCPWYASSCGKAIVATADESTWDAFMPEPRGGRFTEKTVVHPDQLRARLHRARETGVAWNYEENILGYQSVAAPISLLARPCDRAVAMVLSNDELMNHEQSELETQIRLVAEDLAEALL